MPSCSRGCRGSIIDHHASNDADGDGRLDRPGRRRDLRDGGAPRGAARRRRSTRGDGALAAALMAGIVMDTATFAHPNATPRTLVVSAALVEAGRAAVGHLAPALPHQARRPAAPVRASCSTGSRRADDGRIVWSSADRRRLRRDRRRPRRTPRGSSTSCRRRTRPRSRSCSRRPGRRRGSASGRSRAASTPRC